MVVGQMGPKINLALKDVQFDLQACYLTQGSTMVLVMLGSKFKVKVKGTKN